MMLTNAATPDELRESLEEDFEGADLDNDGEDSHLS